MKLASYELSLLAKEKGYDEWSDNVYKKHFEEPKFRLYGHPHKNSQTPNGDRWSFASAPYLYEIVDWLREEKEIVVNAEPNASGWYWMMCKTNGTTIMDYDLMAIYKGVNTDSGYYDDPMEALSEGITKAMNLI